MNNNRAIPGAIDRAVAYLARQQRKDGGFDSYSSPQLDDFQGSTQHQTTFFASLILQASASVKHPRLGGVRRQIADFLLQQKSEDWSFNYWSRASNNYVKTPYPDDLDDTFMALAALHEYAPELLDGAAMAKVSKLLIATEQTVGGPYRTWLADGVNETWRDVDVAVNANIGRFLALQGVRLPAIVQLIEQSAASSLLSPYYPNELPTIYYLAHWYDGAKKQLFMNRCRQQISFDNPLHAALAVSSLVRLGEHDDLATYAALLLDTQLPDGSWPAYAFCIDPAQRGQQHFAGSPSLTTALCAEALALLAKRPKRTERQPDQRYESVMRELADEIDNLDGAELKQEAKRTLARIRAIDGDQHIILLPWLVRDATDLQVPEATLRDLAQISAWGWMAYTTYDDFLDDEGTPIALSAANVALRRLMLRIGDVMPGRFEFQQEARQVLDDTDAANTWELAHCRATAKQGRITVNILPDYGDHWPLAARSFGHALSALGVLYASGLGRNTQAMQSLRRFFWHYLIARQLNDDAHDWQEDLKRGHITAVVAQVLRQYGQETVSINKLQPLQEIFWNTCIDEVAQQIQLHTSRARSALEQYSGINAEAFEPLVAPLELSAQEAVEKRTMTRDFINNLS